MTGKREGWGVKGHEEGKRRETNTGAKGWGVRGGRRQRNEGKGSRVLEGGREAAGTWTASLSLNMAVLCLELFDFAGSTSCMSRSRWLTGSMVTRT